MEKYYVFDRRFRHIEFDSYEKLLGFLGSRQDYYYSFREYEDFSEYDHYYYYIDRKQYWYYDVYDEDLNLLDTKKLIRDIQEFKCQERRFEYRTGVGYFPRYYKNNYLGFRNGPVPGIHKYGRFSGAYRHPHTTQELRANQGNEEYVRGRRKKKTLPNSWDDIGRSNWNSKSWKNQKVRKQWQKKLR
jgi:hypothetical protein